MLINIIWDSVFRKQTINLLLRSIPTPQVEATGKDSTSIPDHEVITRRRQFRMKQARAEEKREKKAEKKVQKKQQKEEKMRKKLEKEAKKNASPKKRGRKASEKAGDRNKQNKSMKGSATLDQPQDDDLNTKTEASECHPGHKVRSRKMKQLKKLNAALKSSETQGVDEKAVANQKKKNACKKSKTAKHRNEEEEQKEEQGENNDQENEQQAAEENQDNAKEQRKVRGRKPKHVEEPEPKEGKPEEEVLEKEKDAGKIETECPVPSKGKKTAAKSKAKAKGDVDIEETKEKSSSKSSSSIPKPRSKAKAKAAAKTGDKESGTGKKRVAGEQIQKEDKPKRTRRNFSKVEAEPWVKDLVKEILLECDRTHCTHPSVEKVKLKSADVDMEPYRTRNACGIKVGRKYFTNKKAQGKGKAHVTYFSGKTPCFYTNQKLAEIWVSRLQDNIRWGKIDINII